MKIKHQYVCVIILFLVILLSPLISEFIPDLRHRLSFPLSNTFHHGVMINFNWVEKVAFYEGIIGLLIGSAAIIELILSKGKKQFFLSFFFGYIILDCFQGCIGNFAYYNILSDDKDVFETFFKKILLHRSLYDVIWLGLSYLAIIVIERYKNLGDKILIKGDDILDDFQY